MIQKHPIDFYRKAISFVDDHVNPEEGHYFERLWHTIFSTYWITVVVVAFTVKYFKYRIYSIKRHGVY